ncbi:MAG: NAD(P)-dependent oxidoreductase [Flavobacteriaceae bacterium]|jgi:alanine dehydrogenase|nr:NAD(P)-dependent oxidoreductase [Flavobacteriaceae bacterium]
MKIAIIKERKNPPDKRAVLPPHICAALMQQFPELTIKVESSTDRVFSDDDYQKEGIEVTNDISDCDVLLGVKEVPIDYLIPNKKYFFFSHTIKKQSYNKPLLKAILEKNIELYDHEVITNVDGIRLVAFGRYAGIVGAYNAFRTYGLKHQLFEIPKANVHFDQNELVDELKNLKLNPFKIVLTGTGRVGNGVKEILDAIPIKQISMDAFFNETFSEPVYVQIDVLDYAKRKDGILINNIDFFNNPQEYENNFERFAQVADLYIAGHFHSDGAPMIITQEMIKNPLFNISVIADISCDLNIPIASTIRSSTIENPIYGFSKNNLIEIDYLADDAIAVMAVDNLPCELPKDSSDGFGTNFAKDVIPAFFNNDKDGILQRGLMTQNGKLTERFIYLQDYVNEK